MEKVRYVVTKTATKIKAYYQYILSAVLITVVILVIYGRDLEILANEALQNEVLSHIIMIPFFVGFLVYLKRDMVKASLALEKYQRQTKAKYVDELIGVSLCLVAFLIYWYGSYTFYPLEYHLLSLPILIMGITLILFNLKTLIILIFPILFILFLIPPPTEIMYTAGGFLGNFNTQAAYTMLKTLDLPVTLSTAYGSPTIMLTTSTGQPASFTIDVPCSGIYTLIAFIMFATFLAFIALAPVYKKLTIFIIGFFVFEILNIFRITAIISAAYWLGEEIAMNIFHTAAGLILIFAGMLLTLFSSEKFLNIQIFLTTKEQLSCPKCKLSQEAFCSNCGKFLNPLKKKISQKFWMKLFLLLLGCSIVALSINAPTFAIAQGPIEVTSSWENATNVFPEISNYQLKFLYRDINYERIARQDASLTYAYFPANFSNPVVYVLVGVASSISNLHSWEVCLITWQTGQGQYPLVSVLDSRDMQLLQDIPIIARYLVFKNPQNYTQVTLYWYEKATFKTGITVQQKYVRISLIILTQNSTSYQQFENVLLNFGQTIASYWEPLKIQSLISLGVPAQQLLLALSIAFVIITKTAQYSAEWRKRTNNLKIFNNYASPEDKLLLQTIQNLAKEKKAIRTNDINMAVKRKMEKSMKLDALLSRLNHLEEYGLIKKDVTHVKNTPMLVWKPLSI
jgi:exosortase